MHEFHNRLVTDKAWLYDQHFISRIDDGTDCKVNGFRTADCCNDFRIWVIGQVIFAVQVVGNFFPQVHHAGVCTINNPFPFENIDSFLSYDPRCLKVRFANAQTDDAFHHCSNVKKFSDAGWLHAFYLVGQKRIIIDHK